MRISDYFRLSSANILGHKKRTFTVIIVISLLFSILTAACLLVSGFERSINTANAAATNGKILLLTTLDPSIYGTESELQEHLDQNVQTIKSLISKYGGEIIPSATYSSSAGTFYRLPASIFSSTLFSAPDNPLQSAPEGALPVLISAITARTWLQVSLPDNATPQQKLRILENVRSRSLGKTLTYSSLIGASPEEQAERGTKYFVAGLLPASFSASSFNLSNVDQANNPFNLILANLPTSSSFNFLVASDEQLATLTKTPNPKLILSDRSSYDIFALFPDLDSAYAYSRNKTVSCSEADRYFHDCHASYLAYTTPSIGNPFSHIETFRSIWQVIDVFLAIFIVIASIVTLTTYSRLIVSDQKTISLYHALGASRLNLYAIYVVYLLCISLIAVIFSLLLALGFVGIINLINSTACSQIFTLAYGTPALGNLDFSHLFIIGWSPGILLFVLCILAAAPVSVLLNFLAFSSRNLSQHLK